MVLELVSFRVLLRVLQWQDVGIGDFEGVFVAGEVVSKLPESRVCQALKYYTLFWDLKCQNPQTLCRLLRNKPTCSVGSLAIAREEAAGIGVWSWSTTFLWFGCLGLGSFFVFATLNLQREHGG